jgi:hypothetical protein
VKLCFTIQKSLPDVSLQNPFFSSKTNGLNYSEMTMGKKELNKPASKRRL